MEINEETFVESTQHEVVAERILAKRVEDERVYYEIRWIGKEDSWELAEDLNCADLIKEFEEEMNAKRLELSQNNTAKQVFSQELEPEQIIGCTDTNGYLQFLVKWKGVDQADLMSAKDVKAKYPRIVLDFFRERLSWNQDS